MKRTFKLPSIITIWGVSFVVFWIISVFAGGDAVSGKIEDGRYYLASHGKYTQVSRAVYVASAAAVAFLETGPVSISLILVALFLQGDKQGLWKGFLLAAFFLLVAGGFFWLIIKSLGCILRASGII
jgi:hypothetical protein